MKVFPFLGAATLAIAAAVSAYAQTPAPSAGAAAPVQP